MNTPSNAGKEHNPDGLTPEQYDSKHYRMLRIGESVDYGDQWWDYREKNWLIVHNPNFQVDEKCAGFRRRTTPPTRDAKCPKCDGKGWIFKGHGEDEQCDCIFVDPPTQSQEGETPETDAEAVAVGYNAQFYLCEEWSEAVSADFARSLERRLTAAQRENDRLRSEVARIRSLAMICAAPLLHHAYKTCDRPCDTTLCPSCAAKALRAATEEGKRG